MVRVYGVKKKNIHSFLLPAYVFFLFYQNGCFIKLSENIGCVSLIMLLVVLVLSLTLVSILVCIYFGHPVRRRLVLSSIKRLHRVQRDYQNACDRQQDAITHDPDNVYDKPELYRIEKDFFNRMRHIRYSTKQLEQSLRDCEVYMTLSPWKSAWYMDESLLREYFIMQ